MKILKIITRILLVLITLLALGIGVLILSCQRLTPFDEVLAKVPEESWVTVNGQRIHVEQAGSGPPLVLLHGFAASTLSFYKIQPELAKHHRTIAIDLNGFGYTERPTGTEAFSLDGQSQMVAAVLDQLGVETADFVGHSYGGMVTLQLAETQPERVRKIVLISPPLGDSGPPKGWWQTWAGKRIAYLATRLLLSRPERFQELQAGAYYQKEVLTQEIAEGYRERLLVEGLDRTFFAFSELMAGDSSLPNLGAQTHTILVLAGKRDAIVPLAQIQEAVKDAPVVELRVLPDCGHSSPEEKPEVVVDAIRGFLRARNSQGPGLASPNLSDPNHRRTPNSESVFGPPIGTLYSSMNDKPPIALGSGLAPTPQGCPNPHRGMIALGFPESPVGPESAHSAATPRMVPLAETRECEGFSKLEGVLGSESPSGDPNPDPFRTQTMLGGSSLAAHFPLRPGVAHLFRSNTSLPTQCASPLPKRSIRRSCECLQGWIATQDSSNIEITPS